LLLLLKLPLPFKSPLSAPWRRCPERIRCELPSVFRLPVSGSCCLFLLLLKLPSLHVLSR
jgi:hypothetical protein